MEKQYGQRDPIALEKAGGYFTRHMQAMTAEDLFDKSAIAEELAWRDMQIDRLRAALAEVVPAFSMTTPQSGGEAFEASVQEVGMNNEDWYDNEIAPALAELAKQCNQRGMGFISVVEYAPGERGGTYYMTDDASLPMRMLHLCARTAPNVDAYVINLRRHCAEHGIDIDTSMVLRGIGTRS